MHNEWLWTTTLRSAKVCVILPRMTRPTTSEAIAKRRAQLGLSYFEVAVKLREVLPQQFWPSSEKVRRYEIAAVAEDEMDPVILAGLADVLDIPLEKLSVEAAEQMQRINALLHCISRPLAQTA